MDGDGDAAPFFVLAQFIMYILFISAIVVLFSKWNFKYHYIAIIIAIWLTRYLNPMIANYSLYKGQKQQTFGGGPLNNEQQDDYLYQLEKVLIRCKTLISY